MNIHLIRSGALGDVLCTTPVIARLRTQGHTIVVSTQFPLALASNRDIDILYGHPRNPDRTINLDLAYERQPSMHLVDAFFDAAFGDQTGDKTLKFNHGGAKTWRKSSHYVTIHAARAWPSRTLPEDFWDTVIAGVLGLGLQVIMVGAGADLSREYPGVKSMVGKAPLYESVRLISGARCHIGSDSALLHFAGTTQVPIVGLYTSVRGKYRAPYRNGVLGDRMVILDADIECAGCLERQPAPVTNLTCARGDNMCTQMIRPELVIGAVKELI